MDSSQDSPRPAGARPLPGDVRAGHLPRVPEPVPPFAPPRAAFPCPALLTAAARAPLGGAREGLLGATMAARLASGMCGPGPLDRAVRVTRAEGARLWLGALAIPARTRAVLLRAIAASAGEEPAAAAEALAQVAEVLAPHLDRGARGELSRLSDALREVTPALAAPRDRPIE